MVVGLGILLVNEMAVIGAYQFNIVLFSQIYEETVCQLLQGESVAVGTLLHALDLMALQFQIIVVTKDPLIPFYRLTRTLHVTLDDFLRHLAGNTCRAHYQSLVVLLQVCLVCTRTTVKTIRPCTADQFDKVMISLKVLCQDNQVIAATIALFILLVLLAPARNIHLTTEYRLKGLKSLLLACFVNLTGIVKKLLYGEHIAVVGDSHAFHPVSDSLVYQLTDRRLTIKNGIIGMDMKMYEILHLYLNIVIIFTETFPIQI